MLPDTIPRPVDVERILCGSIRAFGPNGEPSAIDKLPVAGPVRLTTTGLATDQQGDALHHGGAGKALHHYPAEHYAYWRDAFPDRPWQPGGFGENLSTLGWDEASLCIGDVIEWGEARLQVSQPRQPCWKLNLRFGIDDMARRVQDAARTGWYYRVLAGGVVAAGMPLRVVDRTHPDWSLARVLHCLYSEPLDRDALGAISVLPELAPGMRELARLRLQTGEVENWAKRLGTPQTTDSGSRA